MPNLNFLISLGLVGIATTDAASLVVNNYVTYHIRLQIDASQVRIRLGHFQYIIAFVKLWASHFCAVKRFEIAQGYRQGNFGRNPADLEIIATPSID